MGTGLTLTNAIFTVCGHATHDLCVLFPGFNLLVRLKVYPADHLSGGLLIPKGHHNIGIFDFSRTKISVCIYHMSNHPMAVR